MALKHLECCDLAARSHLQPNKRKWVPRVGAGFASGRVRPETTTAAHYFRIALETQIQWK